MLALGQLVLDCNDSVEFALSELNETTHSNGNMWVSQLRICITIERTVPSTILTS